MSDKGMIEITKAPIVKEPFELNRNLELEWYELGYQLDPYPEMWKLNFFDKINVWLQSGAKYSKLIFIIISLITKIGGTMATTNDKKTTRTGIVKGIIAAIVSVIMLFFSVDISPELQNNLVALVVLVWGIFETIQGYFTNKADDNGK